MRTRLGRSVLAVVSLLSILLGPILLAPAAQASSMTKYRTVTRGYNMVTQTYSAELHLCIRSQLTGKFSYQVRRWTSGEKLVATYRNPKLLAPRMVVEIFNHCTQSSPSQTVTPVKLSQITMKQRWVPYSKSIYVDQKCHLNPSFSVSFPWSVGVSVSPTCSSEKVKSVSYRTNDPSNHATYTQGNTNQYVRSTMSEQASSPKEQAFKLCFKAFRSIVAYRNGHSDNPAIAPTHICT